MFFSNMYATFTKTGHVLGHKASLNKYQRNSIIHTFFTNHKAITKDNFKSPICLKNFKFILLNNSWVEEVTEREMRKYLEPNDNENTIYQICGRQLKQYLERHV